jgi:hypothetical protein
VGSQTQHVEMDRSTGPLYWGLSHVGLHCAGWRENYKVVERRIKPYFEEQAEEQRRAEQTRVFKRNQALGLVLVAVAILVFWLFRTNPKWIFPTGWWRP